MKILRPASKTKEKVGSSAEVLTSTWKFMTKFNKAEVKDVRYELIIIIIHSCWNKDQFNTLTGLFLGTH